MESSLHVRIEPSVHVVDTSWLFSSENVEDGVIGGEGHSVGFMGCVWNSFD